MGENAVEANAPGTLRDEVNRLAAVNAHQWERIEQLETRTERQAKAIAELHRQVYGSKAPDPSFAEAVNAVPEPMGRSAY